jgi:hypothetical protein
MAFLLFFVIKELRGFGFPKKNKENNLDYV